jgi:two-component system cell cycle response regulator DivK
MAHALIVDDNPRNVRVLAQLLSRQGVTSTEVTDPRTLERVLPGLPQVDVVFLDLEMPHVSGFEARPVIQSHLDNTPIVAYTVHISEMLVARQEGFDGFLGKPLNDDQFPDQLTRILSGQSVWERG